ncbi:MAG: DUF2934 domain-containing protein [Phycisphaerales bacterium]
MASKKKARAARAAPKNTIKKNAPSRGKAPSKKPSGAKSASSTASRAKSAAGKTTSKSASRSARSSGKKTMKKNSSAPARSKSRSSATRGSAKRSVVDLEVMPDAREIERRIAERAYFLWCERGGDEQSNWLEAERLVVSELGSTR